MVDQRLVSSKGGPQIQRDKMKNYDVVINVASTLLNNVVL